LGGLSRTTAGPRSQKQPLKRAENQYSCGNRRRPEGEWKKKKGKKKKVARARGKCKFRQEKQWPGVAVEPCALFPPPPPPPTGRLVKPTMSTTIKRNTTILGPAKEHDGDTGSGGKGEGVSKRDQEGGQEGGERADEKGGSQRDDEEALRLLNSRARAALPRLPAPLSLSLILSRSLPNPPGRPFRALSLTHSFLSSSPSLLEPGSVVRACAPAPPPRPPQPACIIHISLISRVIFPVCRGKRRE
jgi:hypothetical protein